MNSSSLDNWITGHWGEDSISDYDGPLDSEVVEGTVFIYRLREDGSWGFVRVHYTKAVCGDCDAKFDDATWVWDEDSSGNPMLVCICGGQMYSTCEDDDVH